MRFCISQDYENEELLDSSHPEFWTYLGISLMLIVCAGIMSGLQLGLLSLDYNTLMVFLLINIAVLSFVLVSPGVGFGFCYFYKWQLLTAAHPWGAIS